jgi:hypothetical protein
MKKALAILMTLALVVGVAFADAKAGIGAWGRNIFTPAGSSEKTILGTSWDGSKARTGFTAYGQTDDIGFVVDMVADYNLNASATDNYVGFGDQQKVWVKPVSGLTLSFGNVYEDTLRGSASFGSYNWIRLTWTGDGAVFDRMTAAKGFVATYTGIENLFIGARLNSGDTSSDTFKYGQYAIGYTIPSVGQIRAQYIGAYNGDAYGINSDAAIEAAFKLTAVQNLFVDIGGKYDISSTATDKQGVIAGTASYKADALTVNALANYTISSISTTKSDLELGIGADYGFDGGITISADVRAANLLTTAGVGALVGVSKGFSNGKVGIGFEYSNINHNADGYGFAPGAYNGTETASWAIPIVVEYWF